MDERNAEADRILRSDRLTLYEAIVPGLAHEINNCNQAILLTAEVLHGFYRGIKRIADRYMEDHGDFVAGGMEYSTIREELQGHFEDVIHAAQSIRRIITDLRSFTRAAHGAPEPVSLNRVIESACTLLANTIRKSTDSLQPELDPSVQEIQGDFPWLLQIVLILVLNACRGLTDRKDALTVATRWDAETKTVVGEVRYRSRGTQPPRLGDPGEQWSTAAWMAEQVGGTLQLALEPRDVIRAILRLPTSAPTG